jgi:hypothetical protein
MPRYTPRRAVAVKIGGIATFFYGFKTSLSTDDSSKFGHKALTSPPGTPVVFGATRPKPARARAKVSTGLDGPVSFCDESKISSADLVQISDPLPVPGPRESSKSTRVYVTYGTVDYAWNQPAEVRAKISDWSTVGVKVLTGNQNAAIGVNAIMNKDGVMIGKPPRARKVADGTGDIDIVSTFYGVDKLPDGWF